MSKPLVLLVLDGWGHNDSPENNAIYTGQTPVWDDLWQHCPKTLIHCSGAAVGLPDGQMGNSEVGHMTIGAGRVIYQNYSRINAAIADGSFDTNPAYLAAVDKAVAAGAAVHVMGLLSPGGVHSHEDHLLAMLELAAARGATRICLHAFLDGRDTPPRSAQSSLQRAQEKCKALGTARIASVCGRYYAMDRDQRWERTQAAWQMLVEGKAEHVCEDAIHALEAAYAREEDDEFVKPTLIASEGAPPVSIGDGDSVIFMNFRPDRARQLTHAFVDDDFAGFARPVRPVLSEFVMTTEYTDDLKIPCAFGPHKITNTYGEYLSGLGKTQLRLAETEKYAHVTFFFNAGQEREYPGEDRILVPSPKVATYDLCPQMSAVAVTDRLVEAIVEGAYDTIICNYANGDMVGHTGVFEAAVKAVETIDQCLGRIVAALREVGGECLITADHGNVEQMKDPVSGQVLTSHSVDPVPLVYVGPKRLQLSSEGSLADIAPTMLTLQEQDIPSEMTGRSLIVVC